jgi:hypothetical protein
MDKPGSHEAPVTPKITPYLLSRDYEDHLDWLENRRRGRNGKTLGSRLAMRTAALLSACAVALTFVRGRRDSARGDR